MLRAPCPATLLISAILCHLVPLPKRWELDWWALSQTAGYCPADFTLWVFRWGADFLLASAEQAPASLVAAVGDSDVDHSFWDTAPLQVDVITRTSRAAINVR